MSDRRGATRRWRQRSAESKSVGQRDIEFQVAFRGKLDLSSREEPIEFAHELVTVSVALIGAALVLIGVAPGIGVAGRQYQSAYSSRADPYTPPRIFPKLM